MDALPFSDHHHVKLTNAQRRRPDDIAGSAELDDQDTHLMRVLLFPLLLLLFRTDGGA
jgi:hypothetical protein